MNKSHIEALRANAQQRFDKAETPEDVKAATEELSHIDELEKESEELEKTSASLLASYKAILKEQPVKKKSEDKDGDDEEDEEEGELSFDEALSKVIAARKKEG